MICLVNWSLHLLTATPSGIKRYNMKGPPNPNSIVCVFEEMVCISSNQYTHSLNLHPVQTFSYIYNKKRCPSSLIYTKTTVNTVSLSSCFKAKVKLYNAA